MTFSAITKYLTDWWVGLSWRKTQDGEFRLLQDGTKLLLTRGSNQKSTTSWT